MRLILLTFFILNVTSCFAQAIGKKEVSGGARKSIHDSLHFTGAIVLSKIGFSPVPSFSFDIPVTAIFLTLSKRKLSYEPGVIWGLNGKPWIIDNWLKYRISNNNKTQVSIGINPGLFFKSEMSENKEKIITTNRNITAGIFSDLQIAKEISLKIIYWYNKRFDNGTLSGHFLDITGTVSDIHLSKEVFISFKPEFFCLNNAGSIDGLFTSAGISIGHTRFPAYLCFQAVQRIWTNFIADNFKWNGGIIFLVKK